MVVRHCRLPLNPEEVERGDLPVSRESRADIQLILECDTNALTERE
jgi:hypothetical protein